MYATESDYEYKSNTVKFQKSTVCLSGNYTDDIYNLPSQMYEFAEQFLSNKEDSDSDSDCGPDEYFQKVKYSGEKASSKQLYDNYGKNVVKGKILFELVLKLDTEKSQSKRVADKVFDFLGVVGGFAAAFEGILSIVGAFFSS